MHELVSERNEQTFRDLIFHFQAGLFGVGVGKLVLHVSQGKLKQRAGVRVRAVVREIVECLTGQEGAGNAHDSRGAKANQAVGRVGKLGQDRLAYVGECGGSLPRNHDVAVVEWTGEQSEAGADYTLALAECVGEPYARLHISIIRRVHLAVYPDVGC